MRLQNAPSIAGSFGLLCALMPAVAAAQPDGARSSEADREQLEPPAATASTAPASTWYSDPFAGMLLGIEAPAGVGLGLVFTQVDESTTSATATNSYSSTIEGTDFERTASLVAYPVGRGVLVTGMFRYVQLNSALDIALGRSTPWTSVAARGGGIGLIGAF
jgi:hypothetical protein